MVLVHFGHRAKMEGNSSNGSFAVPPSEHAVVFVVFPLEWIVCALVCGSVIGHTATKPLLQQNLIDLLNCDFARAVVALQAVSIALGVVEYVLALTDNKNNLGRFLIN